MDSPNTELDKLLHSLTERAKELNCLYHVEELLKDYTRDPNEIFRGVIEAVPPGWQYPDVCRCRIRYHDRCYVSNDFHETPWFLTANIKVQEMTVGKIEVFYTTAMPASDSGPFLKEEVRLIETIAERVGGFIQHQNLSRFLQELQRARLARTVEQPAEWEIAIDLLERTDQGLYFRIARKLLIQLCRSGVAEANDLMRKLGSERTGDALDGTEGMNRPSDREPVLDLERLSKEILSLAGRHFQGSEILRHVRDWMQEDRAGFLLKALSNLDTHLTDIISAVRRFVHLSPDAVELSDFTRKGIRVALIRRVISDDLNYIRVAKEFVDIPDFHELLGRLIYPLGSRGRLGGKSAGLFLAESILRSRAEDGPHLGNVKVPKTWYITSDAQINFVQFNNLEEVVEQKYKDISQVRQEYPHIIQLFKNSQFPPELVQGLSMALDDFGDRPLIVRSSSLLEDRFGAAFSGKYKSLFLANQGSKSDRLHALLDAVAEVYSSTFGPDPIEYRAERQLVDFHEEMSVMIQEVVGTRVGKYFAPTYAGVAFSNNEFRWSPRISREDGLVRMVPGLGTRAVDRLSDDYPILVAPGQPGLQVNVSPEEVARYSPSKVDVINLEENRFETIDLRDFLAECGDEMPGLNQMLSVIEDGHLKKPPLIGLDLRRQTPLVTFRALFDETAFLDRIHAILTTLQDTMKTPVDIEFASDGVDFYLLQCRPQNTSAGSAPATIPRDLPDSAYLFTANRYISNGSVPELTHVVYVIPEAYTELESLGELRDVGRAIGELNKTLPKRQFILIGPGRWGSRGDIKLGVSVTYSDINNTAVLAEVARRTGNYTPDLSFGTHFFQDLVEAGIRYIPLYPDDEDMKFNELFLRGSTSILSKLLPQYAHLAAVVRVIDVGQSTGGKVLKLFMNAELNEAVAVFSQPSGKAVQSVTLSVIQDRTEASEHWRWRSDMAERLARAIDQQEFGVEAMYLIGSTKNGTAGPDSDIDLLIHFRGDERQRVALMEWLRGWSMCLDEINYLRTGFRSKGLLDIHLVSDDDVRSQSGRAAKIDAVTDSAKPLPLGLGPL